MTDLVFSSRPERYYLCYYIKNYLSKSLIGAVGLILLLKIKFSFSVVVSIVEDRQDPASFCISFGAVTPSP